MKKRNPRARRKKTPKKPKKWNVFEKYQLQSIKKREAQFARQNGAGSELSRKVLNLLGKKAIADLREELRRRSKSKRARVDKVYKKHEHLFDKKKRELRKLLRKQELFLPKYSLLPFAKKIIYSDSEKKLKQMSDILRHKMHLQKQFYKSLKAKPAKRRRESSPRESAKHSFIDIYNDNHVAQYQSKKLKLSILSRPRKPSRVRWKAGNTVEIIPRKKRVVHKSVLIGPKRSLVKWKTQAGEKQSQRHARVSPILQKKRWSD